MESSAPGSENGKTAENAEEREETIEFRWAMAMEARKAWEKLFVAVCAKAQRDWPSVTETGVETVVFSVGQEQVSIPLARARAYMHHVDDCKVLDLAFLHARYEDDPVATRLIGLLEDLW